uniref:Glutamate--cysteine ligase n=1 Tax=Biomphalaria glabrata TaxID=6526 RepID=A0A2C9L312_BIOGL
PLKEDRFQIPKSRYDSIDSYISPLGQCYNDIPLLIDQELCDELIKGGVEELLARHIAHLFIRDPVSVFSEKIDLDDENDTDHFEVCRFYISCVATHFLCTSSYNNTHLF